MGGLSWQGILPGRSQDTAGLLTAWTQFSNEPAITTSAGVGEFMFEAFYNVQLNKWASVKPYAQLIINPAGNNTVKNDLILGVSAKVTF